MDTEENNKIETSNRIKILIVLITIILIVLMFPKGESIESDVSVGSIWIQDDLIASTTFEILKDPEVYAREKKQASDNVHMIFQKNKEQSQTVNDTLKNYNKRFLNILDQAILSGNGDQGNTTILNEHRPMKYTSISTWNCLKNVRNLLMKYTWHLFAQRYLPPDIWAGIFQIFPRDNSSC